ncbi:ribonuclease P protein component [Helicobacter saguini]|nr:ribonuclease P protein component [Helicobacter saguini]
MFEDKMIKKTSLDSKKKYSKFIESKPNFFPKKVTDYISISHLKNSFEFDIVFKNSVYFHKNFLTINAMRTSDFSYKIRNKKQGRVIESSILLGFSINKKVGKANKRNLIKRRLKAIMQNLVKEKKLYNLTLIFVARKEILNLSFTDLQNHINYSLKKLNQMLSKNSKFNKL